jgi:hypothetical protein
VIPSRAISTHIRKEADGTLLMRLVHRPTGAEAQGKGDYETAKRYCLNALEHQLGEEIEKGIIE